MSEITAGIYRHFKGKDYQVFGIGRHSESDEEFVVYRPLYGDCALTIRPAAMFTEMVDRDGYQGPRFTLVYPLATYEHVVAEPGGKVVLVGGTYLPVACVGCGQTFNQSSFDNPEDAAEMAVLGGWQYNSRGPKGPGQYCGSCVEESSDDR